MSERLAFLRDENAEEALLIGWICLLAHAVFVPWLPLVPAVGYLVAVARAVIGRESALPPVEVRSLLADGAVASAICLGYGLVPLAVGVITVSLASETTVDPVGAMGPLFLIGSTMTLFVVLAALYAVPIALCGYARGGIGSARPDDSFVRIMGRAAYFVGWTSALVVLASGALAGSVVGAVPLLGPLLAAFVWWVVALASTRRLAAGYRES
ncbi:DUF4013 domain-containing protein [Halalkalicoccus subterraneus]|uniref:DUF4013 domain-containing protein n=1 Tax=Halalkalicoccus subterraneus TaxID=2675002 RepID=UPI000EFA4A39|nr:DUF4013 domain-containing protein [Halalkalicoccus subterraneus]